MEGDVNFLGQLIESLSDAIPMLEKAQKEDNIKDFEKTKDFILNVQKRINQNLIEND
jgi:hypothetical protein